MRHWLWLSVALAAVLAPGAAAAQDEETDATEASDKPAADAQDEGKGLGEDEGEGEGAANAEAKAEVGAEGSLDFGTDIEDKDEDEGKGKGKGKGKDKGQKKAKPEPAGAGSPGSAGVLVGYGFQPYYRTAIGVRAGWDIGDLYVGGTFIYAFGESEEQQSRIANRTFSTEGNFVQLGGEVGYNAPYMGLLFRPYLGLGVAISPYEDCGLECDSETRVHVYLAPGGAALFPISMFFVGADVRYNIALGLTDGSGVMLAGTAGLRF